ncbi:hypothetical protein BC835DRAFT_1280315, partial [Cytidiella melzeri]
TLRRHLQSVHKAQYHQWAKEANFESKLPDDVKKRKEQNRKIEAEQKTLDAHLQDMTKADRVVAYSGPAFHRAILEWIPISATEHPQYRTMMEICAKSPNGIITIPDRNATRAGIMHAFHEQMSGLKDRLQVSCHRSKRSHI